jgi:methoxymalonate biosynthesis acyl carrier protein
MELNSKIREYIQSNLVVFDDEAEFSDSDNIFKLGFVNSLFAMKLLNFVETEFNIVVDNDDININNFSSVVNIVSLVEKKLQNVVTT